MVYGTPKLKCHLPIWINLKFFIYLFSGLGGKKKIWLQCRRPGFNPWVGKISLEKRTATHFSILTWRIPGTEEPGKLQSMGLQRVRHDWATEHASFPCCRARALGTWPSAAVAPRLWSTGSIAVAHGLSYSTACGIFLDQSLNPCLLHWQVDSLPLSPKGNPILGIFSFIYLAIFSSEMHCTPIMYQVVGHDCM